ncbi:type II toxin-antitoxin system prevent-host-death family antitoxin [Cryomorpha ignava]|uniref:Antitoxin n=1 Tax=Cryomorpha ignava TaxID=101383 RepID=A0A7K3WW37_9FLAO|nr:type II toxin-antitoxin system prevent-host-death family antitoxin [Cryomorpha ignava]NEN25734.1 type II toxin-antitoxin system prevent-host-death family antitoxin [Cryomorpha ignava]
MADVINFSDFQENLNFYFEKVHEMGKPLCITVSKGKDIVVMSKSDYNGMLETLHLLSSPKNAERLLKSIQDDKVGEVIVRKLIE